MNSIEQLEREVEELKEILRDARSGSHYRYPPCCVVWFALGKALGVDTQALRRGVCVRSPTSQYVPCCHWLHPDWRPLRLVHTSRSLDFRA